jgi:molecular chaperone GrpE (heat shock protein)
MNTKTQQAPSDDQVEQQVRQLIHDKGELESLLKNERRENNEKTRKLFLEIIDVCDAFDRFFKQVDELDAALSPDAKRLVGNIRTVERLLARTLKNNRVQEIHTETPYFDPHWHKIDEVVKDPTKDEGFIVEQVHKGYAWQGTVLREAVVRVVRNRD